MMPLRETLKHFLVTRIIKPLLFSSVSQNFHGKPFISGLVFHQTVKPCVKL